MNEPRVNYDVLSPVQFLIRSANVYPDKTAVVYGDTRYTYSEFYARVNRLADALKKQGIGLDDKVAFLCPNIPPMLEAHSAVPMIGAVLVSINIRLSPSEISYIINHSDAKAVFVDTEFAKSVQPILKELNQVKFFVNICDGTDERPLPGTDYEDFLATGSPEPMPVAVENERQVATINYTAARLGCRKA